LALEGWPFAAPTADHPKVMLGTSGIGWEQFMALAREGAVPDAEVTIEGTWRGSPAQVQARSERQKETTVPSQSATRPENPPVR
jgi:hypothetical protein